MEDSLLRRQPLLRRAAVSCLLTMLVLAFHSVPASCAERKPDKAEPTIITSETLVTTNRERTAVFEGQVRARRGDVTLFADKMRVIYSDDEGANKIRNIFAEGNVKLVRGSYVITARSAEFLLETEEKVVFSGEPRASDGENLITGSKMTYYVKDDRAVVDQSKAFLTDKKKR